MCITRQDSREAELIGLDSCYVQSIISAANSLWVCGRNLPLLQLTWSGVSCLFHQRFIIITFIRWIIWSSKNSMELIFNTKFDFIKDIWNGDWTTSHHKHPVCQCPAMDMMGKLTNVWSRFFRMNRITGNWHCCLGIIWSIHPSISSHLKCCTCTKCWPFCLDLKNVIKLKMRRNKNWETSFEWCKVWQTWDMD